MLSEVLFRQPEVLLGSQGLSSRISSGEAGEVTQTKRCVRLAVMVQR